VKLTPSSVPPDESPEDDPDRTLEVKPGAGVLPFSAGAEPPAETGIEDDDGLSGTLEVDAARLLAAPMPFVAAARDPGSASRALPASAGAPAEVNVEQVVEPGTTGPAATTRKGLTVAEFARIRALLDAGQPRAGVLAAHGLTDARWREEEEQVLSDLADAAERADLAQLGAYQEAYRATWRQTVGEDLVPPGGGVGASTATDPELAGSETLEVDLGALAEALPFKSKKTDEP
jgi:hypothetical protein